MTVIVSPQQTALLRLYKQVSDRMDAEITKLPAAQQKTLDRKRFAFTKTAVFAQLLMRVIGAGAQSGSIDETYLSSVMASANNFAKNDESIRRLSMAAFVEEGIESDRLFPGRDTGPSSPSTVTALRPRD